MWQWNDGTCELYHYGVLGMKWGHHGRCTDVYGESTKGYGEDRTSGWW